MIVMNINFIKYLSTLIGITTCLHILPQYHIIGEVLLENNETLISGDVLAYNIADSSFINGGTIVNGKFDLFPIEEEYIILKIRSSETLDFYQNVSNVTGSLMIDLGKLL